MKALIVGAGVAGTSTAIAMKKAGIDPHVYEAYDQSAGLEHGVFLTVAVNGIDALRAIDLDGVVTSQGFPTNRINFSSGTGRSLGSLKLGPALDDGAVTQTIRRSDLYQGLYQEAVRRGVPIEHGKRLVQASLLRGGGVSVSFTDGTSVEGDLLVGADGVHSAVRSLIDPTNPKPRYAGLGNIGGFTSSASIDVRPGDYEMVWGKRCFFGYTVSPDGEIWWFANPPSRNERSRSELRELTTESLRAQLLELLSVDQTPGAEIVRATQTLSLTNQYDLPAVSIWQNSSMVIIGDAAHAVSPSSGQGVSLAVEDAVVLAQSLRDASGVREALKAFELCRRERVERIVKWGAGMNNTKQAGIAGWLLRELALPFILKKAAKPEAMDTMAWMYLHHIDWDTHVSA